MGFYALLASKRAKNDALLPEKMPFLDFFYSKIREKVKNVKNASFLQENLLFLDFFDSKIPENSQKCVF